MKNVYQLSDLANRDLLDADAEKPAKLAVIGAPVAHSASPQMHQAALDELNIDTRYIRLEVPPGSVAEAITQMKQLGFIGCNVTVPHKFEVMDCCDELTDDAKALGAVNTIIFGDKTIGHNTDAPGLVEAIKEDFDADVSDLNIMILGTGGGAGKAVATQCARMNCPNLWLVNRTVSKAQELADQLNESQTTTTVSVLAPTSPSMNDATQTAQLIINATSLGLKEGDPLPIDESQLHSGLFVYDMIYNPSQTELLKNAEAKGAHTANGFTMLLHQGVLAFQAWFPDTSPLEAMRKGLSSTL
ncbi:shikimate dehydrogenase [Akkermansiaceae bacterium]|nr:shikimate dehydrogenase [Akkermansiaceae bacterium]